MVEVTPRMYIFGIIMFTIVVWSGIYIMGSFAESNPSYINSDKFSGFNRSFNRVAELNTATSSIKSSITDSTEEYGTFGVINSLIKSVWSAFKNIFTTFDFMLNALDGLSSIFGVPKVIIGLLSSLVVIMLAFSIYSLVFAGRT